MTFTQTRGADNHVSTKCDHCGIRVWTLTVRFADVWKRQHVCRKDTP